MSLKELLTRTKLIVGSKMKYRRLSSVYDTPTFTQKSSLLQDDQLNRLRDQLLENGIITRVEKSGEKILLKVFRGTPSASANQLITPVFMFLLTILTTMFTGSLLLGFDPLASFENLTKGSMYSFALLTILLCHEMGHYIAARIYKVKVTLPYFIPFFLPTFQFGTMGAFIKIKAPIPDRKALFDIGIAGPLAGFVVSLVFVMIGLNSLQDKAGMNSFISTIHPLDQPGGIQLVLGRTILFDLLVNIFGKSYLPMSEIYHFPFIFAGWFGLLVTSINLMPIGQLDGGHITYSMFGDQAQKIAIAAFALIIVLNFYLISYYNSFIWILWTLLILVFIRLKHPPTLRPGPALDLPRRILGWFSYLIFLVCFSPLPLYIAE